MKTTTFSQFRNNAKKYFDAVENGETIQVYRHGKPVAVLSPVAPNPGRWKTAKPVSIPGVSVGRMFVEERRKGPY